MTYNTSIDEQELAKFRLLSSQWWDTEGALKTLHDINPARIAYIQDHVPLKDKTVLDVGCGGGILSEALAQQGARVTGIDAESTAIASAMAHAESGALAITYVCTSLEAYDEAEGFDVITCMEMLEHVSHPAGIIKECARVLRPGGALFLSTLNRTMTSYLGAIIGAEYLLNLLPRQTHDYNKFIKPSELAHMVREAGLLVNDIKGLHYNPFTRDACVTSRPVINYLMFCQAP